MVGYAYQLGAIPLSSAAIEKAIELNGEAVAMNKRRSTGAARGGRSRDGGKVREAHRRRSSVTARVLVEIVRRDHSPARQIPHRLTRMPPMPHAIGVGRADPARRSRTRSRQERACRGGGALPVQADGLQGRVRGRPPLYRRRIPQAGRRRSSRATNCASIPPRAAVSRHRQDTGLPRKMSFGPWMMPAFRVLAKFKGPARHGFDPFGRTARAPHRAQSDRRLRGRARRGFGETDAG